MSVDATRDVSGERTYVYGVDPHFDDVGGDGDVGEERAGAAGLVAQDDEALDEPLEAQRDVRSREREHYRRNAHKQLVYFWCPPPDGEHGQT